LAQLAVVALLIGKLLLLQKDRIPVRGTAAPKTLVRVDNVEVSPGEVGVEKGSGFEMLATFPEPPGEATLVVRSKDQPERRVPLARNLSDPTFGGGLPSVNEDLQYHIEYAGLSTREYKVRVFEHPELNRADAALDYPDYTQLA